MIAARLKFGVFVATVLVPPGVLMATGDARLIDLGKLAMILSPGVAGLVLNLGRPRGPKPRWPWVGVSTVVTLVVAGASLAVAVLVGAADFEPSGSALPAVASAAGISALTSVLEELGWAGGGLALAVAALGRRWGVVALGSVWAAWHLIPALLRVGLFPDLEKAPPAMLGAFVVSCLVYRELLTALRERARTWWAAAAGHAAPNILLAGLMTAGLGGFGRPGAWPFFPAPGGLVFPLVTLAAVLILRRIPIDQ
ncbi:MAG TPA: CPBP family glutamic-type intramembrane protease [Caulobacteraceae bacterium]|nr:CPBP family glutamic-type intramembrane protease [Caulobacteraceae bacterium]